MDRQMQEQTYCGVFYSITSGTAYGRCRSSFRGIGERPSGASVNHPLKTTKPLQVGGRLLLVLILGFRLACLATTRTWRERLGIEARLDVCLNFESLGGDLLFHFVAVLRFRLAIMDARFDVGLDFESLSGDLLFHWICLSSSVVFKSVFSVFIE
jgi:hypothetical protein